MSTQHRADAATRLRAALDVADPSIRLRAALASGTHPHDDYVEVLIERCAIEPDFFVRDMLTWSLTRHPSAITVPRLIEETKGEPQARSQALHTLSKIGDPRGWSVITHELLRDPDDDVARSAWRAAVVLVPEGDKQELAHTLATQLGRGDRAVQLSLSRALVALGDSSNQVLADAATHPNPEASAHAIATERLVQNPDEGFEEAIFEAKRTVALKGAPIVNDAPVSEGALAVDDAAPAESDPLAEDARADR